MHLSAQQQNIRPNKSVFTLARDTNINKTIPPIDHLLFIKMDKWLATADTSGLTHNARPPQTMEQCMKAMRIHQHGPVDQLQLEPIAEFKPGPGEALIQMHAAGVNPVDHYTCAGINGYSAHLPYTPGRDGAGVITALGEGSRHFKEGDRVYCAGTITGSFAHYALCDIDQLFHLPEQCSYATGACVGIPYGTAYRALFHSAHALPGEIILIHGASGGVGTAAVQLALSHGMTVIASAGSQEGLHLLHELGAHLVLDHRDPKHLNQIHQWTHRHGADVVLEMLANQNLDQDLKILATSGRVIVIGSRGQVEINPRDLMARDASIHGVSLANVNSQALRGMHAALGAGIKSGALKPVIRQEFSLDSAAQALGLVMQPGAAGNLVIKIL